MSSKYPFYVTLEGDGEGLLMGQHVYIEPDYGQEDTQDENLINLPSYFINDAEGKPWVWAQNSKGKLEKRSITLESTTRRRTLSCDGRPDGGGHHRLSRRQPEGGHDVHHL